MTSILLVLLSASVIATIGTIFYHFFDTSYETETAMRAIADESRVFEGVFVRDETLLTGAGNGAVSYQIPDGGKMATGDVIAEIYADSGAIERQQKIEALEAQLDVLERISNPGTLEQAQPADLSRQISEYYQAFVQNRDRGKLTAAAASEEQFLEAYSTYQIVISKGAVSFAEQIAGLKSEIEKLNDGELEPESIVTAESSGYFISETDGYEEMLKPEKLSEITPERLKSVLAGENAVPVSEHIIGKSVAQYDWYMLGLIDNQELKYQVDDTVTLRLLNSSVEADATIQELRKVEDSDQVMVVLHCDTMSAEFVQNRTETVEMILCEYEGIKVPRDAIRFKDVEVTKTDETTGEETVVTENRRGVYVQDGEKLEFKILDVVYEGDSYVISKISKDSSYLMLYDSIIVEGIDANGN